METRHHGLVTVSRPAWFQKTLIKVCLFKECGPALHGKCHEVTDLTCLDTSDLSSPFAVMVVVQATA